jgi:hypothetical protein
LISDRMHDILIRSDKDKSIPFKNCNKNFLGKNLAGTWEKFPRNLRKTVWRRNVQIINVRGRNVREKNFRGRNGFGKKWVVEDMSRGRNGLGKKCRESNVRERIGPERSDPKSSQNKKSKHLADVKSLSNIRKFYFESILNIFIESASDE